MIALESGCYRLHEAPLITEMWDGYVLAGETPSYAEVRALMAAGFDTRDIAAAAFVPEWKIWNSLAGKDHLHKAFETPCR